MYVCNREREGSLREGIQWDNKIKCIYEGKEIHKLNNIVYV